jgi:acetolactate synthase small subunit
MNQHTLSVLLQDGPAGLHRASSLLRRGAVRVSSLTLAASETPGILRMTVSVDPVNAPVVARHLGSLVEVLSVRDVTPGRSAPNDALESQGAFLYTAQADGATGDDTP